MKQIQLATITAHFNNGNWKDDFRERERLRWMIQQKMGYANTSNELFKALLDMYEKLF